MLDRRVLTLAEVRRALGGIGKSSLYRLIQEGLFPEPLPVTAQGRVWLEADVNWYLQYLEMGGRLRGRRPQPPGPPAPGSKDESAS
jgi:predicted DNA-binding transcriptional regulator AlpA